jgi:hypothetical protein
MPLAFVVAGILTVLGIAAAAAPDFVVASSRRMVSPTGIYAAAMLRVVIGLSLVLLAPGSSAPKVLRLMGLAVLVVGMVLPLQGVDGAKARIEWEAAHTTFLRLEGLVFVWAGYVIYKLSRTPPPNSTHVQLKESSTDRAA